MLSPGSTTSLVQQSKCHQELDPSIITRKVLDQLDSLLRPESMQKVFADLFDARSIGPNSLRRLQAGGFRPGDLEVIQFIASKVANRSQDNKVNVLGIGDGTSYPVNGADYGAPWLARAIALALGNSVDILTTDFIDPKSRVELILVTGTRQLILCKCSSSVIEDWYLPLPKSPSSLPVEHLTEDLKSNCCKSSEWEDKVSLPDILSGTLHFRPIIDPEVESNYQLNFKGGVNYLSPQSVASVSSAPQDLVFARWQTPVIDAEERSDLQSELRALFDTVCAPDGAILYFPDNTRAKRARHNDPIRIPSASPTLW